jgi:hypothetical protein
VPAPAAVLQQSLQPPAVVHPAADHNLLQDTTAPDVAAF